MENKVLEMKIVDGKFLISVDPNKNGVPVIQVSVDLAEVPAEVVALFKKDEPVAVAAAAPQA